MKYDVVLDSLNDYFPHDTTPLSLAGVKEVKITKCVLNGITVVARLINFTDENEERSLLENEDGMTFLNDHNKPWGALLFVAHNAPQGQRASFNCEFIYL